MINTFESWHKINASSGSTCYIIMAKVYIFSKTEIVSILPLLKTADFAGIIYRFCCKMQKWGWYNLRLYLNFGMSIQAASV